MKQWLKVLTNLQYVTADLRFIIISKVLIQSFLFLNCIMGIFFLCCLSLWHYLRVQRHVKAKKKPFTQI